MNKNFPELFKKYRLKAEFETLSSFGNALAEKGFFYEDSMYSHWQKGARVPTDRSVIFEIIKLFIERGAITTTAEANEFLSSAQQGFLTDQEISILPKLENHLSIFQIPREIANFTGREDILHAFLEEPPYGKVILIHGPAGVGKTTLAIKLGHTLQQQFLDGVLWYRMDTTDIQDIFLSILHSFNQIVTKTNDIELLASSVRSLLVNKKILLILDNCESAKDINSLLPSSKTSCGVILLSRNNSLDAVEISESISLKIFTRKEVHTLFARIFDEAYVKKYQTDISHLTDRVGNLPLAVNIFARQLHQSAIMPKDLLNQLEKEETSLQKFSYEKKNLYIAINMSFNNLSKKTQSVFLSLGVFKGRDFSVDAIALINGLSVEKTRVILHDLFNASLIEESISSKFRIHPMVKKFISEKLNNPYVSFLTNLTFLFLCFFTLFWIIIQITKHTPHYFSVLFTNTYTIAAFGGGLLGMFTARKWGGWRNSIGKAIVFFSLGLFAQTSGQVLYAIYDDFFHANIIYPSPGDIAYIGSIPLYIYAVTLLSQASGTDLIKTLKQKLYLLFIPITILAILYGIFLNGYTFVWSNPVKIFLDFAYPLGDMIFVFLTFLTYLQVRNIPKSILKNKVILILIALSMQFLSDYVFVYQINHGEWQVAQINDYMYFISYILMTFALIRLNTQMSKLTED